MNPLWTSEAAQAATGGRSTRPWQASGVSIDTRSLEAGELFVALRDQRDGHDFVAQALENGAAAALVSRVPDGVDEATAPLLIVEDVLRALEDLARAARARARARVVAVTGSVGKTSTKEMLRSVLSGQGRVHAAEASFNNHWGVPLTLARLPEDAAFAIIEIGMNHPGEIAPLARLARPHVALVTNVAAAHLEAFDGLAAIAREKGSIFEGLEPGGAAVIPSGCRETVILADCARMTGAEILSFGKDEHADMRLLEAQICADTTVVRAACRGAPCLFKLNTPGLHFAINALAALGVVEALRADRTMAALDLANWRPPGGRGARETIVLDVVDDHLSLTLIDDAYNANPTSLAAALEVLSLSEPHRGEGRADQGRRIAFLGDMLELGQDEMALHREIAGLPAMRGVDVVHCAGPRMKALFEALPEEKRGIWCEDSAAMAAGAHKLVGAGDVILVKGSKGSRVSRVVDAIRKLGHPQAGQSQGAA